MQEKILITVKTYPLNEYKHRPSKRGACLYRPCNPSAIIEAIVIECREICRAIGVALLLRVHTRIMCSLRYSC